MTTDRSLPDASRRLLRHLLVLLACALLLACGGGDDVGPTGLPDSTNIPGGADSGGVDAGSAGGGVLAGGVGSGGAGLGNGDTNISGGVGSGGTGSGGTTNVSGGVGSGGSGLAEGGVSGYGSLIVDGRHYDDSLANVVREDVAGEFTPAATAIGQQVRLTLVAPSSSVVTRVEVRPQLIGRVTARLSGGLIRVLGQPVRVDASTVVADHVSAAHIGEGATVEVHGHWVPDKSWGYVLAATRVSAAEAPGGALVSGVIHDVQGSIVTLNGPGGTQVQVKSLPAGQGVGALFAAWVEPPVLPGADPLQLRALRVRGSPAAPVNGDTRIVSGPVWHSDIGGGLERISVQGLDVMWRSTTVQRPVVGSFVLLSLKRQSDLWEVVGEPTVSTGGSAGLTGGTVEITDTLDRVEWKLSAATMLTLRGTAVQVSAGKGCSAIPGRVAISVVATLGPLPLPVIQLSCVAVPADGGQTATTGGAGSTTEPAGGSGAGTGGSGGAGGDLGLTQQTVTIP